MAPSFGENSQLLVIGWEGRIGRYKRYIVKCNKCSQDSELFGEGYFTTTKQALTKGSVPCGCAKHVQWTKEQYRTLCERAANSINYEFIEFKGEWKGAFTRIIIRCNDHGVWDTGIISTLIHSNHGCPQCGVRLLSTTQRKPDDVMIRSFLATKAYHPDTKFWRSDREDIRGHKVFWKYLCLTCGEIAEASSTGLQKGSKSCLCSPWYPTEAYINFIMDDDVPIAIKFGISGNKDTRLKQINRRSIYEIQCHSSYLFKTPDACRKAETLCKQKLECGVISSIKMQDGYTETTWLHNLEKVIEIYERNGGIRVE